MSSVQRAAWSSKANTMQCPTLATSRTVSSNSFGNDGWPIASTIGARTNATSPGLRPALITSSCFVESISGISAFEARIPFRSCELSPIMGTDVALGAVDNTKSDAADACAGWHTKRTETRGGLTMKLVTAGLWAVASMTLVASHAHAEIKIGIVVSASGPGSALGQPQMRTIGALPNEIGGEKVVYVVLDDESDPTKGTQSARRLVIQDRVDVLIGSSLTPVTMPMIDVAMESKTPIISLAAATSIVKPMDDRRRWAFKVVPNDDIMALAILKHVAKSGTKTPGYIAVSDGYGEGYYNEVSRLAPTLGLTITTHEVYARADTSATGQALKVMATNPDAKASTPEFRTALRDELEQVKDVYLNNGLSSMTPADHNGYDQRSAFLIKVEKGKFRLAQ